MNVVAGIDTSVKRRMQTCRASVVAGVMLSVVGAGCDIRPLSRDELFGATTPDGGTAKDGSQADVAGPLLDAHAGCVPADCAADQYCDELSGRCASRFGQGMLSGVVRDACTGDTIDARVGIAGRRQCSVAGKGNFFFSNLPLGDLKLAAFKVGYRPFDANVVVAPGGTIFDVMLEPDTVNGCNDPPPATDACTCTDPGCEP